MTDETRLEGERPQDPRMETFPADAFADADEHLHGAGHTPNSQQYHLILALSVSGHIDRMAIPHSQESQEEREEEEKKKRDDLYHHLRMLILQQIDGLKFRNEHLEKLIAEAQHKLEAAEKEREELVPLVKKAQEKLKTCGEERDQALKILDEVKKIQEKAEELVGDAQNAFPTDAIKNVAQITFILNNGNRPDIAEVKVPVFMENGKYYFFNPRDEKKQEITDEKQKAELREQLEKGIKTYDVMDERVQHRMKHYDEAATNFIWYALEADRKRELVEQAERAVKDKQAEYVSDKQYLEELTSRLADKDKEIEELKEKIAGYRKELEENKEKIATLEEDKARLDTLYAEQKKLRDGTEQTREKLSHYGSELNALAEKTLKATQDYLASVKAHDDYSDQTREVWDLAKDYWKNTKALRAKGATLEEELYHDPKSPESHVHLSHVVNGDDFKHDPETMQAILRHEQQGEELRLALREYFVMGDKTNEFADYIETPLIVPLPGRASVDTNFSNEAALAEPLTPGFNDAAGALPGPVRQLDNIARKPLQTAATDFKS